MQPLGNSGAKANDANFGSSPQAVVLPNLEAGGKSTYTAKSESISGSGNSTRKRNTQQEENNEGLKAFIDMQEQLRETYISYNHLSTKT